MLLQRDHLRKVNGNRNAINYHSYVVELCVVSKEKALPLFIAAGTSDYEITRWKARGLTGAKTTPASFTHALSFCHSGRA
jgi:hypothetical protein